MGIAILGPAWVIMPAMQGKPAIATQHRGTIHVQSERIPAQQPQSSGTW